MLQLAHMRAWVVASAALVGAVLYLSLAPMEPQVELPANFDKVEHALAYTFLAVWFAGLYARKDYWRIGLALAVLGLTASIGRIYFLFIVSSSSWTRFRVHPSAGVDFFSITFNL